MHTLTWPTVPVCNQMCVNFFFTNLSKWFRCDGCVFQNSFCSCMNMNSMCSTHASVLTFSQWDSIASCDLYTKSAAETEYAIRFAPKHHDARSDGRYIFCYSFHDLVHFMPPPYIRHLSWVCFKWVKSIDMQADLGEVYFCRCKIIYHWAIQHDLLSHNIWTWSKLHDKSCWLFSQLAHSVVKREFQ